MQAWLPSHENKISCHCKIEACMCPVEAATCHEHNNDRSRIQSFSVTYMMWHWTIRRCCLDELRLARSLYPRLPKLSRNLLHTFPKPVPSCYKSPPTALLQPSAFKQLQAACRIAWCRANWEIWITRLCKGVSRWESNLSRPALFLFLFVALLRIQWRCGRVVHRNGSRRHSERAWVWTPQGSLLAKPTWGESISATRKAGNYVQLSIKRHLTAGPAATPRRRPHASNPMRLLKRWLPRLANWILAFTPMALALISGPVNFSSRLGAGIISRPVFAHWNQWRSESLRFRNTCFGAFCIHNPWHVISL
jgi:hypothetical protein